MTAAQARELASKAAIEDDEKLKEILSAIEAHAKKGYYGIILELHVDYCFRLRRLGYDVHWANNGNQFGVSWEGQLYKT